MLRTTNGKFNLGRVQLEGIGECKGRYAEVTFQNENLCASVDGRILATAPDLICLVDTETFIPVTTDGLKYGKRVLVVGLKCYPMWRTPKGLELVGPRVFRHRRRLYPCGGARQGRCGKCISWAST